MTLEEFLNEINGSEESIITYSGSEALSEVKKDGHALSYVKDQTSEVCLAAVKKSGCALQYVKDQTPEVCLAAVTRDGYALRYVDKSVFSKTIKIELTQEQLDKIKHLI